MGPRCGLTCTPPIFLGVMKIGNLLSMSDCHPVKKPSSLKSIGKD